MAFLQKLAPNGQQWAAYVGSAPPATDNDGRLVGSWGQCLNASVVFEKTNSNWQEMDGFEDGPAGQVIAYAEECGYGTFIKFLEEAEGQMHEEMNSAEGDPLAFLQHRARNGMTWKDYCAMMGPSQDGNGMINGAWGDCLTAAVIFEKQNPEWSNLPAYMDDGPAGQVVNYFNECGHAGLCEALDTTEQETHASFESGGKIPVYDDVYQAITGTQEVEIDEEPPEMTGRKKAFLVGCNYPGTSAKLNGCVNDVHMWKDLLVDSYGFDEQDMVILTDEGNDDPRKMPTLPNMRSGLQWLTAGAQPGDVLFFQFSGHGTQIPSKYSDEADGKDEALCPCDYNQSGFLVDNEVYDLAVNGLQSGVKLTIILDCCHSGTAVDLPFIWDLGDGTWQEENGVGMSSGDVQMISGCEDCQTSMDVTRNGRGGGAMTCSMNQAIKELGTSPSYPDLLQRLHEILDEQGMTQKPRLTSSQRFDVGSKSFHLTEGTVPNGNSTIGVSGAHRRQGAREEGVQGAMDEMLGL